MVGVHIDLSISLTYLRNFFPPTSEGGALDSGAVGRQNAAATRCLRRLWWRWSRERERQTAKERERGVCQAQSWAEAQQSYKCILLVHTSVQVVWMGILLGLRFKLKIPMSQDGSYELADISAWDE